MKATLEFDLKDEDDAKDFVLAQKGVDYYLFVEEFDRTVLRQAVKYGTYRDQGLTPTEIELFDKIRSYFWELAKEKELDVL